MKKISLLSVLVLIMGFGLTACNNDAPDNSSDSLSPGTIETSSSDLKRYGVKSGSITYNLTGSQTGSKTITWDDWGMTERTDKDSTITAAGVSISSQEVTIMKGEWMYTYNPIEKTGTKIKNTILEEIAKNSNNKDLGEVGLQILNATGAEKTGTETIAGETCDVYEITSLSTTTCVWKALNLKNESNLAGIGITEVATSISTDTPDASLFEIPSDVTFQDLGDIGNILNNL